MRSPGPGIADTHREVSKEGRRSARTKIIGNAAGAEEGERGRDLADERHGRVEVARDGGEERREGGEVDKREKGAGREQSDEAAFLARKRRPRASVLPIPDFGEIHGVVLHAGRAPRLRTLPDVVHHRSRIRRRGARAGSGMPKNGSGRRRKVWHSGASDLSSLHAGWVTV